ncbi:FHA domain-containing protein [Glycomyces sambucus]|uniref:FHA domain-containing protein n=1 Tax=Glycomyces sambucus TaxID=380244 RepID=A0A1G9I2G2_9ACTN|nr:FHA domain-containing protein [Glycomyces sambucus]SDL19430.1 FHA domain-containing protein [Glycomyces sambucus]
MTVTCPSCDGESADTEWCDHCGRPLAGGDAALPLHATGPILPQPRCPACGERRLGRFCQACGYNFEGDDPGPSPISGHTTFASDAAAAVADPHADGHSGPAGTDAPGGGTDPDPAAAAVRWPDPAPGNGSEQDRSPSGGPDSDRDPGAASGAVRAPDSDRSPGGAAGGGPDSDRDPGTASGAVRRPDPARSGGPARSPGADAAASGGPARPGDPARGAAPPGPAFEVLVSADRDFYDRLAVHADSDSLPFPPYAPDRTISLRGDQVRIGRGRRDGGDRPEIDLAAAPADIGVSHLHAVLMRTGDTWSIVDLGSYNGTRLGGRRLEANVPVPLPEGTPIHLGAWTAIRLRRIGKEDNR